jgi:hypothetical protein
MLSFKCKYCVFVLSIYAIMNLEFIKLDDINWYKNFTYFVLNPIFYFFWLVRGYAFHYLSYLSFLSMGT